jgi:hypothetical protein
MEYKDPNEPPHESNHHQEETAQNAESREVTTPVPQLIRKEDPLVKESKVKKVMDDIYSFFKKKDEGPIGGEAWVEPKDNAAPRKMSGSDRERFVGTSDNKEREGGEVFKTSVVDPTFPSAPKEIIPDERK